MDIFGVLELIGGLALFLFGMSLMGTGLEKSAGNRLKSLLERLTTKKLNGFLLGIAVTAIIQSSSATTVMVVGFVNSGIMTLKQAIHIIMGANVGTTVTAWILSLAGIEGSNLIIQLLKPSSFTPILALIGIIYYMFIKDEKKKDLGMIMLGFAVLIFGMETMSSAVKPLGEVEGFRNILLMFSNPILGVLAGAVLTGILQSSSASVGILQALSATGMVTMGTAIPIIMGQNIGTCVTALISSVGTNKNARRAALVHLYFNLAGTLLFLTIFTVLNAVFRFSFVNAPANHLLIAISHTVFNISCTAVLLPFSGLLEKLAYKTIPESDEKDKAMLLDSRLFSTPALAINRSRKVAMEMAAITRDSLKRANALIYDYDEKEAQKVQEAEDKTDQYEDALGTYLVRLSNEDLSARDNIEAAKLLYLIGEFERIADYATNVVRSAKEMHDKKIQFSDSAKEQMNILIAAVEEALDTSVRAFTDNNLSLAKKVEPLEEVIDGLKSTMKRLHVKRLQQNECTIEMGFIFSDLITVLERVSDHCSNIAGCVIEMSHNSMGMHNYVYRVKHDINSEYKKHLEEYSKTYAIAEG